MAVSWMFSVEVGDADSGNTRYDLTNRVRGISTSVNAPIGRFGRGVARIDLNNVDGALTPNGSGTFAAVDWFSQGVFIEVDVVGPSSTTSSIVFHGIVVDFDLVDDGLQSFVTLSCIDGLTVGGSSVSTFSAPSTSGIGDQAHDWIRLAYNGYNPGGAVSFSGVDMPLLGEPNSEVVPDDLTRAPTGTSPPDTLYLSALDLSQPALDWLNNTILPSGPNVAWPTTIVNGPNITRYRYQTLNVHLVRSSSTKSDLVFAEGPSTGELPFRNLTRGFTVDQMVNQSVVTNLPSSFLSATTLTVKNDASVAKYGVRSFSASALMVGDNTSAGVRPSFVTLQSIGERYSNVQSEAEFVVRSLSVTGSMVNGIVGGSQTSADAFAQLLDVQDSLWQLASVEFTPTGESSATVEDVMVVGRSVAITPEDVTVTLELLPYDYSAAFILDDSFLGVLDQNRLG
jgi:hypothetical protein